MNLISKIVRDIRKWKKRREMVAELNALSNRDLFDIGISRYDIEKIVRESFADK